MTNFFDDDAAVRLGEAILTQLQQDYVKVYMKYLKKGPDATVFKYGKGTRSTVGTEIKDMDLYIRSNTMTAEHADAIIEELRRQARVAVEKGLSARKINHRKKVWAGKEITYV